MYSAQDIDGALPAAAASRADAELRSEMLERAGAVPCAFADGALGDRVAEADVQSDRFLLSEKHYHQKLGLDASREHTLTCKRLTGLAKRYLRNIDEHNENYYRHAVENVKPSPATQPGAPKVNSETLLGKARALVITHNGREYQLRVTQNGKLILTA